MVDARKKARSTTLTKEVLWKVVAVIEGPGSDRGASLDKAKKIMKLLQSAARRKRGRESADV